MNENTASSQEQYTLSKSYEFVEVERRWYARWLADKAFDTRMEAGHPSFCIVIPPPNVTGVLHIGHALNNTLQDILIRYHRMRGDNTLWLPGTDHAGIATQNVVERQLKSEGLRRQDLGREKFIERVWSWKEEKGGSIINQLKHLGSSCDWDRERFTMDEGLSRAVREVFVRLYKEGLIYKGDYIVNWCPRCQTALADDEVEYEQTMGKLYHIRYPFSYKAGSVVVATTRPETMLADTAVAVHPDDERYNHLQGMQIVLPLTGRTIPLIFDHHVEKDFGTGVLKVTPAHDRNDYEIGLRHDLPLIKVMDEQGVMNEEAGTYAGLERFTCRERIVHDLKVQGFLVAVEDYEHSRGHCYRCKTVIETITSKQWFVSVRPLADKAVAAVQEGRITIYPNTWYRTFYTWMENIRDWCISRQIWWGHRIPAWNCQVCDEQIVDIMAPDTCPSCGSTDLLQEEDVLDTWFSSALWPFSTLGWPENTKELETFYPTSVLITSFDILFFWVARMMMMGLHFMGEVPFRDVYLHALVRDKFGKKMSKSTGNVIDPLVMIEQYGTDAFRFTLTAFAAQGREIRLDEERIDGYRRFINKLWNAARFAEMHLQGAEPNIIARSMTPASLALVHRWMLHRCNFTIRAVRTALDGYLFNEAASSCYQFIWHEFCDWYLEWIKPDLFSTEGQRRSDAQAVLLTVLEQILQLLHPICPFVTEEIWCHLPGERSPLISTSFPEPVMTWDDPEAEQVMQLLQEIISGLRSIRTEAEMHPATQIEATLICPNKKKREVLTQYSEAIRIMVRASSVQIVDQMPVPEDAGHALAQDVDLVVSLQGLIDVEEKLEKLTKERAKLEQELQKIIAKLGNAKFMDKAPQAVVQKERDKEQELRTRLRKNQESEDRLRRLK